VRPEAQLPATPSGNSLPDDDGLLTVERDKCTISCFGRPYISFTSPPGRDALYSWNLEYAAVSEEILSEKSFLFSLLFSWK